MDDYWYELNQQNDSRWKVNLYCNKDKLAKRNEPSFYSEEEAESWAKGFIMGIKCIHGGE